MSVPSAKLLRVLRAEVRKLDRIACILACVAKLIENGRNVDVLSPMNYSRTIIAGIVEKLDGLLRDDGIV